MIKTYSITNDTLYGVANISNLQNEIANSSITIALESITSEVDTITITFKADLTYEEQLELDSILTQHNGFLDTPLVLENRPVVVNASDILYTNENFNKSLNKNNENFSVVYEYNSPIKFKEIELMFNSDKVIIKVEVNGNLFFEKDLENDSDLSSFNQGKSFNLQLPFYASCSNLRVLAKANSQASSRKALGIKSVFLKG